MKRPIILVNEGCSMSSFTSFTIRSLIKAHGYPVDIVKEAEIYRPDKNPYYEEGMGLVKLLDKTFTAEPSICCKLPFEYLKQPNCLALLKQKNARICVIERFNLLDTSICTLKDFPQGGYQGSLPFGDWRRSKDRLEKRVDPSLVLEEMKKQLEARRKKQKVMETETDQKEFVYAEALCCLDINAYKKVFKILGYDMDMDVAIKLLAEFESKRKTPYKHADVLYPEGIDKLRASLKELGFMHYWR
jgi:hypothetical protein